MYQTRTNNQENKTTQQTTYTSMYNTIKQTTIKLHEHVPTTHKQAEKKNNNHTTNKRRQHVQKHTKIRNITNQTKAISMYKKKQAERQDNKQKTYACSETNTPSFKQYTTNKIHKYVSNANKQARHKHNKQAADACTKTSKHAEQEHIKQKTYAYTNIN